MTRKFCIKAGDGLGLTHSMSPPLLLDASNDSVSSWAGCTMHTRNMMYRFAVVVAVACCAAPVDANYRLSANMICESQQSVSVFGDCCTLNSISTGYKSSDSGTCSHTTVPCPVGAEFASNWPCLRCEIRQITCSGNARPALITRSRSATGYTVADANICSGLLGGEAIAVLLTQACPFDDQCLCPASVASASAQSALTASATQSDGGKAAESTAA
jgi:hypothetical protein